MVEAIVNGLLSALEHSLGLIPWQVWLGLALVAIIGIAVLRFITNPHIAFPLIAIALIIITVLGYRAHWIDEGKAIMQAKVTAADAQVEAYRRTNGLVIACYNQNGHATYLWDRSQGKCLRADGAVE